MTDWNDQGLAEQVGATLESMSRLSMEATTVESNGWHWPAVRPAANELGPHSFSIALVRDPLTISAQLYPDPFAGQLVRAVGAKVLSNRTRWREVVESSRVLGISVDIRVNDIRLDVDELPEEPWRSLEIDARLRVRRWRSPAHLADMWGSAAGVCLCLVLAGLISTDADLEIAGEEEGLAIEVISKHYERNPINRLRSLQFHGFACWCCDIDLAQVYPGLGDHFIEVHHIIPVSEMGAGYLVDPITEMVPLCPNCHGAAHRTSPPTHPSIVREILGREPKQSVLRLP
jgi:5-methylcytosine-specific restriction protein A